MPEISLNTGSIEQTAKQLMAVQGNLASMKEKLEKANNELCMNWTGEGSSTMKSISSLTDWYLGNLVSMAEIEAINLYLAKETLTETDRDISKSISTGVG